MKHKILTSVMGLGLVFALSGTLMAHQTGNERRTVKQCDGVAHPKRCRACTIGHGKHYHPKLNICHKNLKKK